MACLYLPASLSTSDMNEALHVLLVNKHRCFCFMGWWDEMELTNQSANAVLPHSCNFKAGSHTHKKGKLREKKQQMKTITIKAINRKRIKNNGKKTKKH